MIQVPCKARAITARDQYATEGLRIPRVADIIRNMRVAYRTVAPPAATLGLAAAAWVVTVRRMHGMDMGVATQLGSFAFFVALWAAMMAAMMLPGLVPAVLSRGRRTGPVRAVVPFVASYLVDVPLALAIVAFGILIIAAPGSVPGLMPPM